VEDATDWERRLGMITVDTTALADRKAAILTKMAYPGVNAAKQHRSALEGKLQAAGFDLYVFENVPEQDPSSLNAAIQSDLYLGEFDLNDYCLNKYLNHLVVNSADNLQDILFDLGINFRCCFFVSGTPAGTMASVPASRETELRQLILKWKPVQTVAILYVTYT
jgi:hypothetical protein